VNPYSVIVRPILSEKSNNQREASNKYTFTVAMKATKDDVEKAVKALYDVKVENVRTMIKRGKIRRKGTSFSKPVKSKKAIVTLAEGSKIPLFEDQ